MQQFDTWYDAINSNNAFNDILFQTVTRNNLNIGLNLSILDVYLQDKTKRPKMFYTSLDFTRTMLFSNARVDSNVVSGIIPQRYAYSSLLDFQKDFSSKVNGEIYTIRNDSLSVIQLKDNPTLPDVQYNVYIGCYAPNTFTAMGNTEMDKLMMEVGSAGNNHIYNEAEFKVLALSGNTPQTFISDIDPTKTLISRIGGVPAANEYDVLELAKDLFIRESNLAKKHGNLREMASSEFAPPKQYVQIAKEISKDDTIILLNHKYDTAPKDVLNEIRFNTILFIPVSSTIDEFLAEEKIKRELIRLKLKELLASKIGGWYVINFNTNKLSK